MDYVGIYKVYGINITGTLCFNENYMDFALAKQVYKELSACKDVSFCCLISCITGEIFEDYERGDI